MRLSIFIFSAVLVCVSARANVDLRTSPTDIYYRGSSEQAGLLTMSVTSNDFFAAKPESPIFIRLRLDNGSLFCHTLVDFQGMDKAGVQHTNVPIYLAMRLEGSRSDVDLIGAPPDTVSIVRWIAGEAEMWLRVKTSSNRWIRRDSQHYPPSRESRVAFTVGITARDSYTTNYLDWTFGRANLPYNTADLDHYGINAAYAVSTLACLNVFGSVLRPKPETNSWQRFDTIAFEDTYRTLNSVIISEFASSIVLGNNSPTNFSGEDKLARGHDYPCGLSEQIDLKHPFLSKELGPVTAQPPNKLICREDAIGIAIDCPDIGWKAGSEIALYTPDDSNYGFPVETDPDSGEPMGYVTERGTEVLFVRKDALEIDFFEGTNEFTALTLPSFTFRINDQVFTRLAVVLYDGPDIAGSTVQINIHARICAWSNLRRRDIQVIYVLFATNRSTVLDSYPFDGSLDDRVLARDVTAEDQRLFCPPGYRFVGADDWVFQEP